MKLNFLAVSLFRPQPSPIITAIRMPFRDVPETCREIAGPRASKGSLQTKTWAVSAILFVVLGGMLVLAGTGCGTDSGTPVWTTSSKITTLSGTVHGGQQPVVGAKVYLYAASTTGNGGLATPLFDSPGYIVTDANGDFSFTGADFTCPAGGYLYFLATGGNPGLSAGTSNSELALGSGVGPCANLGKTSFNIDEVTTVAMAYALAGFATTEAQIGSGPAYASGLKNAFANIANLVDPASGQALATTPAGNGIVPQAELNSLANILSGCVNSDGTGTPCSALMAAANVTSSSGMPVDTFQAALNIAHNPGVNVTAIYRANPPSPPFQPVLTEIPNDWTMTLQFSGSVNPAQSGLTNNCSPGVAAPNSPITDVCLPLGIAVDAAGNIWIANSATANLVEFSPAGSELSPGGGYSTPSMNQPRQIGIDQSGNVWTASQGFTNSNHVTYADSVQKFSSTGTALSGAAGFTGGGLHSPGPLAIDVYGNVWVAGTGEVSQFSSTGTPASASGYPVSTLLSTSVKMSFDHLGNGWVSSFDETNGDAYLSEFTPGPHSLVTRVSESAAPAENIPLVSGSVPQGQAVDASNNVWAANLFTEYGSGNGGVIEYTHGGELLSPASGYTDAGIVNPNDLAIDGSGNVFTSQSQIGEISNAGVAISPPTGYQNPNPNDCCLVTAIDNAGNLWLTGGVNIYQMLGLATPVITPIVATLPPQSAVSLSPSSPSITQAGRQVFTASLSGATAASYQWTTTAIAGLLNEVGGTGQTNQTSYCSTSAQSTYIPNATPVLNADVTDQITVQAFRTAGCAGSSFGTSSPATITVTPVVATGSTVVILSPAAATMSQGGQQLVTASVAGATAASYRWQTTGTAGLLNEVGGVGQTDQISYCSTSPQTVYASNATPALTSTAQDTLAVQAFSAAGCVASIGSSAADAITVTPPLASTAVPGFPTTSWVSTVELPPGSTLSPDQLTVVDSVSQTTPSASGTFMLPSYGFGSQIAIVVSPSGNPMLMGWLDATHTTISATTTAEVLAYYALGGDLMFTSSDRSTLDAAILNSPALAPLAQVVANEIGANSEAFAQLDGNLQSALNTFFTSVSGVVPTPFVVGGRGSAHPMALLVNPGAQSGENVEQLPPFQADITNNYRRRTHAFVQRISDTAAGSTTPVPDPLDVTDFEVSPVTGLAGGVVGTVEDIYAAYWGNTTAAYAPTTSDPFSLPLTTGFAKTTYQVTIVGPGPGNLSLINTLTDQQATTQVQVSVGGFVTDALIPFASNFLFGSGFTSVGENAGSAAIAQQAGFVADWRKDLTNDLLNALSQAPTIQNLIIQGNYGAALKAMFYDTVTASQAYRNLLITAVQQAATKGWAPTLATPALQAFNNVLNAAGGVLQIFDSSVYVTELFASDAVDQWSIVVTSQKVTLSPNPVTLNQFGTGFQLLTANVPGADTTGYSYYWTNTGNAGNLTPISGSATTTPNTGFCSSSNQVDYVASPIPILTLPVIDTVTVQAFTGANCVAANQLGSATAAVTVSPNGVTLNPAASFIAQTAQQPLTAKVTQAASTAGFSYLWTTTGTVGTLTEVGGSARTLQTSYCSTSAQANYVPNPLPTITQNGFDTVTVQAFNVANCVSASSLGTSTPANVTVTATTLLLTPRNQGIAQNQEATLLIQVSGSTNTNLSFEWTTTGNVGLLNEVGGAGQQNQYSYCSSSAQSTYIPNDLPVLTAPTTPDVVSVQAFTSPSCDPSTAVSGPVSTTVPITVEQQFTEHVLAALPSASTGDLIEASDGNFYGTTQGGGPSNAGTIFKLTREGVLTQLYAFSGPDGSTPYSGLIEGSDGNLYGTTFGAGAGNNGTIFQITLKGVLTTLYAFSGLTDGSEPEGALVQGSDGNFYGTTRAGGTQDIFNPPGVFFTIDSSGDFTALTSFTGLVFPSLDPTPLLATIASRPGTMIQGADGNFYGTSEDALGNNPPIGANGLYDNYGTIFEVTPGGNATLLYTFQFRADGAFPNYPSLVQGPDGSFYGTTPDTYVCMCPAGLAQGSGDVFQYNPNSGNLAQIFAFSPDAPANGQLPYSGVTMGSDGALYGTTALGGNTGCGVYGTIGCGVFYRVTTSGAFTNLYDFGPSPDANNPTYSTPLQASDGNFYGLSAIVQGTSSTGAAYEVEVSPGLPAPVQLSLSANPSPAGQPVTLTWKALQAYSTTAQLCFASVQGSPAGAGSWSGFQTGTLTGAAYGGSTTITPTAPGSYTYALTCGGRRSGFATLNVQ